MASDSSLDYYRSSILWLFLAPALGGFLFGYDIGGTSYAILQLTEHDTRSPLSLKDAPLKTGWFVSAPSAGALLGTALLVYINQQQQQQQRQKSNHYASNRNNVISKLWFSMISKPIGRRTELYCAGILYTIGGLLQLISSKIAMGPFVLVSVGRWIYGAGIGFAMHGGPTYLAETTPPSVRGMVVGAKEIAIVVGILTGYVAGNTLCVHEERGGYNHNDGWAYVYGLTIFGALAMIVCSTKIPESPRYLISSSSSSSSSGGRLSDSSSSSNSNFNEIEVEQELSSEVLESLRFVWKPKKAQEEHRILMELYHEKKQQTQKQNQTHCPNEVLVLLPTSSSSSIAALLSDPSIKPALTAGLGLVILQQITGQPSVLSYATPILSKVPGLSTGAPVLLALFKVLATSISVVLVERYGRKKLLLVGCSFMLAALMVLVFAFRDEDTGDVDDEASSNKNNPAALDTKSLLALLGMFAYIAGYQVGFGPITWLMISEVFPQSVRGTAVALSVQANFLGNAVVQLLVPLLQSGLGMSRTFCLFGIATAYALWFVHHSVPETKGLTLEEIEIKLAAMVECTARTKSESDSHQNEIPQSNSRPSEAIRRSHPSHDQERIRLLPS